AVDPSAGAGLWATAASLRRTLRSGRGEDPELRSAWSWGVVELGAASKELDEPRIGALDAGADLALAGRRVLVEVGHQALDEQVVRRAGAVQRRDRVALGLDDPVEHDRAVLGVERRPPRLLPGEL